MKCEFLQYLDNSKIIDVESLSFEGALGELVAICGLDELALGNKILSDLLDHERAISTCIGRNVAIPHIRVDINCPYIFAVGRCKNGLPRDISDDYKGIRYIVLMLSSKTERSYLDMLTNVVHALKNDSVIEKFDHAVLLSEFQLIVTETFGSPISKKTKGSSSEENKFFFDEACKLARRSKCSIIMILDGVNIDGADLDAIFENLKVIITLPKTSAIDSTISSDLQIIIPSTGSSHWVYEFHSAVLLGLSRDIIKHDDKICCIGSNSQTGNIDTIFIIDVQKEFRPIFSSQTRFLKNGIKPEVLEKALAIASEISIEGREGKSVGCLFVIGDVGKIKEFSKPLVLNPFFGYKEEDKNILNPFMDETIKEFSLIDGAFIIGGDGVIESAGSLISAPDHDVALPGGLGSRHSAAASISWAAECISIAVSQSTHKITLFQNGQMLPIVRKDMKI